MSATFKAVLLLLAGAVAAFAACRNSATAGQVQMKVNGVARDVPILQNGGTTYNPAVTTSGSTITTSHGSRWYLGNPGECPTDWSNVSMIKSWPLLGASVGFTMDISAMGCGCNAAFYLIQTPAYNSNQQVVAGTNNDYYCDANQVGGYWCPEIDLVEANTHAFQWTPHKCDNPTGKYYPKCDKWGCGNKWDATGDFGPSKKIDTSKPMDLTFKFVSQNNELYDISTTIKQGSNVLSMSYTDDQRSCYTSDSVSVLIRAYLKQLTKAVSDGMTIVISNWGDSGSTMAWLDSPPCDQSIACSNGNFILKDLWYCSDYSNCDSAPISAPSPFESSATAVVSSDPDIIVVSSAPTVDPVQESSAAIKQCTLSSTLPLGGSGFGTCATKVAAGTTCKYSCLVGFNSVQGVCDANGDWSTEPDCETKIPTGSSSPVKIALALMFALFLISI